MADPASIVLKWGLNELSKAVVGIVNRAIQVRENRNAASRVSVLLSGITIGLARHESDDPDVYRRLEGFENNTVPRIGGLIEECHQKRSYMAQHNAKLLYNRLREAEQQLFEFMAVLKMDLPPPSRELLDKYPEDQDQQLDVETETQYKAMAENNFKQILAQVCSAGQKVFQYRKYKVFREVVDLVFLCDATGGMENNGVFDKVKDSIADVIQSSREIVEKRAGLLRVGLVAYRDVWDEKNNIETEDLTPEAGQVISHVRRLVATGGMDIAEDVVGGLEAAANLSWAKHANKKVIVHFADAPCHGAQYHALGPKGDFLCDLSKPPTRSPSSVLKDLMTKKVSYVFVKMNDSTDMMIKRFKMILSGNSLKEVPMADPMLCSKILKAIEIESPFTTPHEGGSSEFSDQQIQSIDEGEDSPRPTPKTPTNVLSARRGDLVMMVMLLVYFGNSRHGQD